MSVEREAGKLDHCIKTAIPVTQSDLEYGVLEGGGDVLVSRVGDVWDGFETIEEKLSEIPMLIEEIGRRKESVTSCEKELRSQEEKTNSNKDVMNRY